MEQKIKLLNQENNQIMVSIYLIIKPKQIGKGERGYGL